MSGDYTILLSYMDVKIKAVLPREGDKVFDLFATGHCSDIHNLLRSHNHEFETTHFGEGKEQENYYDVHSIGFYI